MKKRKRAGSRNPVPRTAHHSPAGSLVIFVAVCVCALAAPQLGAKQKPMPVKTILGAVLNSSNAGVTGASVMLTNLETRHTDAIYSGPNGKYTFSGLDPNDDYQLQATYRRLQSAVRRVSSLDSRSQIVINLVLTAPHSAAADSR
ncbi:MAG: carboxypeptidase-like regulatory domain-containing protein [Terriglobia bacterium]